jgi:hypothetical protein
MKYALISVGLIVVAVFSLCVTTIHFTSQAYLSTKVEGASV